MIIAGHEFDPTYHSIQYRYEETKKTYKGSPFSNYIYIASGLQITNLSTISKPQSSSSHIRT